MYNILKINFKTFYNVVFIGHNFYNIVVLIKLYKKS
jgi:hypothetical protein